MKKLLLIAGLLSAGPAFANDYEAIVQRAVESISDDYYRQWAFTESGVVDDLRYVARFDPRLPEGERWTLVTVDGREPTIEERLDYLDDKEDEYQWDDDEGDDNDTDMVDFETLELIEETDDYWLFSFVPNEDDLDGEDEQEFMENVTATLKVVRDGHYLEYIDMRNEKPIRPAFSVRISQFHVRMTFGPADAGGPIVPYSEEVAVKGRAMLFVIFNENESVQYSDYEFAGD